MPFRLGLVCRTLLQNVSLLNDPICGNMDVDGTVAAWRLVCLSSSHCEFHQTRTSEDVGAVARQHNSASQGDGTRYRHHHFPDSLYPLQRLSFPSLSSGHYLSHSAHLCFFLVSLFLSLSLNTLLLLPPFLPPPPPVYLVVLAF